MPASKRHQLRHLCKETSVFPKSPGPDASFGGQCLQDLNMDVCSTKKNIHIWLRSLCLKRSGCTLLSIETRESTELASITGERGFDVVH